MFRKIQLLAFSRSFNLNFCKFSDLKFFLGFQKRSIGWLDQLGCLGALLEVCLMNIEVNIEKCQNITGLCPHIFLLNMFLMIWWRHRTHNSLQLDSYIEGVSELCPTSYDRKLATVATPNSCYLTRNPRLDNSNCLMSPSETCSIVLTLGFDSLCPV